MRPKTSVGSTWTPENGRGSTPGRGCPCSATGWTAESSLSCGLGVDPFPHVGSVGQTMGRGVSCVGVGRAAIQACAEECSHHGGGVIANFGHMGQVLFHFPDPGPE